MSLKDQLRQLVRGEFSLMPEVQGARIGVVTKVNTDNTAVILIDGRGITASLLYPVVKGQPAIILPGDLGGFVAAPTRPAAETIELEHPPFFAGGATWRFLVDEVGFVDPFDKVAFRLQDDGSKMVYRVISSDITVNLAIAYRLSQKATKVAGLWNNEFGIAATRTIRSYRVGPTLVADGVVNPPEDQISLLKMTVLQTYGPITVGTFGPTILDVSVDEEEHLWFLDQIDAEADSSVIPTYTKSGIDLREDFYFGSQLSNTVTLNLNYTTPPTTWTVEAFDPFPTHATWVKFNGSNPLSGTGNPGAIAVTIDATGLSVGMHTATIQLTESGIPTGRTVTVDTPQGTFNYGSTMVSSIILTIFTPFKKTLRLQIVTNGVPAIQSSIEIPKPTFAIWIYNPAGVGVVKILDAARNLVGIMRSDDASLDVLDFGAGTTPAYHSNINLLSSERNLRASSTKDYFIFNMIGRIGGPPSIGRLLLEKDGVYQELTFTNPQTDLNPTNNFYSPLSIISSEGDVPKKMVIVDGKVVVRHGEASGSSITVEPLPGILNISPGETDTTKVRKLASQGSIVQILGFGLLEAKTK